MENKFSIFVCYHKKTTLYSNDFIHPIHVGRSLLETKVDLDSQKNLLWLKENMIGDNTGENISNLNANYNELTAIYWAWKNYDKIGNPKHVGFMHYRRHFYLNKMCDKKGIFESIPPKNPQKYLDDYLGLTEEKLDKIFEKNDLLVTRPFYKDSVKKHFIDSHGTNELDAVGKIIKKDFKEFAKSYDEYINGHNVYFCNMFVMTKDLFFKYCEFLFGVLNKFVKSKDYKNGRLYVSERITGVFIQYCYLNNIKIETTPVNYVDDPVTIPVACATNKTYLDPTNVMLYSMLSNANSWTKFIIYIMTSKKDFDFIKEGTKFLTERFENAEVKLINMDSQFENVEMSLKNITFQTYYRLKLASLLPQHDKCIYLDGDIIVNEDLSDLYRNDIASHYIAGVHAPAYTYPKDWVSKHKKETGIPNFDNYINAGVLLLNLKKIRNDHLEEKMINLVACRYSSQDQDILNKVCYGKIKILPFKYNVMTKYIKKEKDKLIVSKLDRNVFGSTEVDIGLDNPCIIHYADKNKPWFDANCPYFDLWNKYAVQTPGYCITIPKSKISVIIPVYNMEQYLKECLDSVFKQTLKDISVICINDGSTDSSYEILLEYKKKYKNLVVINQSNHGVAYSRNVGLDLANSEFVCYMDPDDMYPSKKVLETLYKNAKAHKVSICGGSWSEMNIQSDGSVVYKDEFFGMNSGYTFKKSGIIKYSDYQFDFGYHRFIYKLDLLRERNIKFPLYSRFQDPPYFLKAMIAAKQFFAISEPTYCYRVGYQGNSIFKGRKIIDLMLGFIDDLRISSREHLAKLHKLTLDRFNYAYAKVVVERYFSDRDPYLFELLVRLNSAIDRRLLKTVIPEMNENYIIPSLKQVIDYYNCCLKQNRISDEPIETFFEHTKRYLRLYGIRAILIRILFGEKFTHNYLVKRDIRRKNKKTKH